MMNDMSLKAKIRNIAKEKNILAQAVLENYGISFSYDSIAPIRDDDEYGGYRVSFSAQFGKINAPMSMDVSTGDVITPGAAKHWFSDILEDGLSFELSWATTSSLCM